VFSEDGTPLGRWGQGGAARAQFANPAGICASADGQLFIVDLRNHRVQQFQL
jgi:hypothetical protein